MLLEGWTHNEIVEVLHCSFATIAKVSIWLEEAGLGLKEVIKKLPERQKEVSFVGSKYRIFKLPEALWEDYLNLRALSQKKRVENLLKNTQNKKELFDKIQETVNEWYREKNKQK